MGKTVKSVFQFLGKTALIISRIFIKARLPDPCEMSFCGHLGLSSSHLCASEITLNELKLMLPVNLTIFTDWREGKEFELPCRERSLWGHSTVFKILCFHDFALLKQNIGITFFRQFYHIVV